MSHDQFKNRSLNGFAKEFKLLFENTLVGLWKIRIGDGAFVQANIISAKIAGYEKLSEFLNNCSTSDLFDDMTRKRFFRKLKEQGEISGFEAHLKDRKGYEKDISVWAKIYDEHVQGVFLDITGYKMLQKALEESEAKYRHLFESAPFVIGLLDLDGKVLDINVAVNQFLTSRTKDDLIGKNFREIFSINGREKVIILLIESRIKKMLNGENVNNFETKFYQTDGSVRWVNFYGSLIKIDNRKLIQILIQDITERKKAEQELKRSEAKFRRIFESIPDMYFLVSKNSVIIDYKGMPGDFYVPPEEFMGKKLSDVLPKELSARSIAAIQSTIERKTPIIMEYNLPIDGKIRYFEARHLFFSKDRVAIFIREITEKKKAEFLVKEEILKLREIEQIRKNLISRVSHELKTPLIPIISGTELLNLMQKGQISEDAQEIIDIIHQGGLRLLDLIENLINVSRIEYDKLEVKKESHDLCDLIRERSEEMRLLAKKRRILFKFTLPEKLLLNMDRTRIGEVITNLVSNAIKNTPINGRIKIKLRAHDNWAIFTVRDTGVGLTRKEMEQIFTRFGKIERYDEGLEYLNIKGSGLGLFISKEIVDLHGGQIWAESAGRNKGSTFFIKLPINN
ncbi:MAG: PAS domain-containing sensor histidine kinase [Promethearchaeota archaeon]